MVTQGVNVFKKMIDIFKNPIGAVKQIAMAEDKVSAFSMVITNVLFTTLCLKDTMNSVKSIGNLLS